MSFLPPVLLLLTLGYAAAVLFIRAGLKRLPQQRSDDRPFVSVVTAARNEEENLPTLLDALLRQDYPRELCEFIIVDDQSEDATAEKVTERRDERLRLLRSVGREKAPSPKKNAIEIGIRNARGEIILVTDADCVPPPNWVSGMARFFTPETGMVIGFSPCELPRLSGFTDRLLALDSLALAAVAAGTCGWNAAATCNGRNLAYRKRTFEEVGGFAKINRHLSGDDDLLLGLVQKTAWKIRYADDPSLIVPTRRVESLGRFIRQRLRHASKGFSYGPVKTGALMVVYLYHLLLLASPFTTAPLTAASALIIKIGADFLLLHRFAARMRRTAFLSVLLPAELLYVPYVVIFGALGPFIHTSWKGSRR